jgi:hypothetical protein
MLIGECIGGLPVAKRKMVCPFSNRLCEECALYRGRHHYLCFCEKYRGYLAEPKDSRQAEYDTRPRKNSNGKFEMPTMIVTRAIDPFATSLKDNKKES